MVLTVDFAIERRAWMLTLNEISQLINDYEVPGCSKT
jgi:hypothetical protein